MLRAMPFYITASTTSSFAVLRSCVDREGEVVGVATHSKNLKIKNPLLARMMRVKIL